MKKARFCNRACSILQLSAPIRVSRSCQTASFRPLPCICGLFGFFSRSLPRRGFPRFFASLRFFALFCVNLAYQEFNRKFFLAILAKESVPDRPKVFVFASHAVTPLSLHQKSGLRRL
jgi:hypothetical protein